MGRSKKEETENLEDKELKKGTSSKKTTKDTNTTKNKSKEIKKIDNPQTEEEIANNKVYNILKTAKGVGGCISSKSKQNDCTYVNWRTTILT